MPIDTSSYYPEVPGSGGPGDIYSLNKNSQGLFGSDHNPTENPGEPEDKNQAEPPKPPVEPCKKEPMSGWEKFMTRFSNIISWVFVPLMMPVYGLILAFGLSVLDVAPMGLRVIFTLIVAAIDVVVPMAMIGVLKKIGIVSDLGLNGRKERLIPYVIMIICYGITTWFMAYKGAPLWLSMFFAGGALAALVNLVINFWWKISAHAAGIAGIVALLIRIEHDGSPEPQLMFWLIATIILAGLLGSARVWLERHTVWQVLAGYVVGFCAVFFLTAIR